MVNKIAMETHTVAMILFITGISGLGAVTLVFPLLGVCLYNLTRPVEKHTTKVSKISERILPSIAIIMPVYNDSEKLDKTIPTILSAVALLKERHGARVDLFIGLDGCTDSSAEIALKYSANMIECNVNRGKWQMICTLVEYTEQYDWIVMVDAGVIWKRDFLCSLWPFIINDSYNGIVPAYRPFGEGIVGRIHWGLERLLKSIENYAGGPVSVHGATVAYRNAPLLNVIKELSFADWKNDDVVIPLMLRAMYPVQKLYYLSWIASQESGIGGENCREHQRRERIMQGNTEWIRDLLPYIKKYDSVAFLLSMRRLFRVLWAYWLLALLISFLLLVARYTSPSVSLILATIVVLGTLQSERFIAAVRASLRCPLYLFLFSKPAEVRWR